MDNILLDTSGLYALIDLRDGHHKQSLEIFRSIIQRQAILTLPNFILAESHTVINKRLGPRQAREFLNSALTDFQIERITVEDELTAHAILQNVSRQQDLSYFDAVTIAIAQRLGINEIFSFDRHYSMMGLKLVTP